MARLAGVDIPNEKRIEIALTYIRAKETLAATGISPDIRVVRRKDTATALITLRDTSRQLRVEVTCVVKSIFVAKDSDSTSYQGQRHRKGLPQWRPAQTMLVPAKGPSVRSPGKKAASSRWHDSGHGMIFIPNVNNKVRY